MEHLQQFYIDGKWVRPSDDARRFAVIDPATEIARDDIFMAGPSDVDRAIQAARAAFCDFSVTSPAQRVELLGRIATCYERRIADIAQAISHEMGAPYTLAAKVQAPLGLMHLKTTRTATKNFQFERTVGHATVRREAAGVCVLITPWNWPMNQIMCKLAPALAAGCTVVLKPSEFAPLSANVLAEVMDEAKVPAGVFNMIYGDGAEVGPLLSSDPRVDMISLTGSTRAGESVSRAAASTFKKVTLELGGKSANIILPDADLDKAIRIGVTLMMSNTGQSCNAPSRMFVQRAQLAQVEGLARKVCKSIKIGDPADPAVTMGPIANQRQYKRVQSYIEKGLVEGAKLVCGGPGKADGTKQGYYAKPTVFSNVSNDMVIAREEIFGPVLTIIPYDTVDDAIDMANHSDYGLSGYVFGADVRAAAGVAARLRTGMVHLNGANADLAAPFGGYKHSGIGREWGEFGIEEFTEVKSVFHPA